jgi:hypothetical protein
MDRSCGRMCRTAALNTSAAEMAAIWGR